MAKTPKISLELTDMFKRLINKNLLQVLLEPFHFEFYVSIFHHITENALPGLSF